MISCCRRSHSSLFELNMLSFSMKKVIHGHRDSMTCYLKLSIYDLGQMFFDAFRVIYEPGE